MMTTEVGCALFTQNVSESDIDWLLCMELNSNRGFRDWFAEKVVPDLTPVKHERAWRSIANDQGESDLVWCFRTAKDSRHLLLIENKINATAQSGQCERYVSRGEGYVSDGKGDGFSLLLVAPAKYRSQDSEDYPSRLDYEDMMEWFRNTEDERGPYLASLLESAINKRVELAPVDENMFNFYTQVFNFAKNDFPELNIPTPESKNISKTQNWVTMKYSGFKVIYKMQCKNGIYIDCYVDLQLDGRGEDVDILRQEYEGFFGDKNITVVRTNKSASFRIYVPLISPPHFEEDKVREALTAAQDLITWWKGVNGLE